MNRPVLAIVALCAVLGSAAAAQQPGPAETANPELQPAALLERAYAITRDLPLDTRADLLAWMLYPASRIEPQLARSWADELFQIAQDLTEPSARGAAEISAVDAMARIDVDHALELFRHIEPGMMSHLRAVPLDARTLAARNLFAYVVRKKKFQGLALLRQEAQRLAQSGAYPYCAMAFAADQLLHADRAPAEQLFADALAVYQQSTPTLAGNAEFVEMLRDEWRRAVPSDAQQALAAAVNNLLGHPEEGDENFKRGNFSVQGVAVDHPTDYLLLQLLPAVRQLQPDLLTRIAQSRPALSRAVNAGAANPGHGAQPGDSAWAGGTPDQAVMNRLQRAASSDPQAALAASNQWQDPATRSQALAAVASGMAAQDPQQAAQLLTQAQQAAAKIDDQRKQLQAILAMAQAANRMNNQAVLRDSIARGFVLGNELLQIDQDAHPDQAPSYALLSPLVRAGAHTQLDAVVAGIEGIQNLPVKARLLVLAAQSMPHPRRPLPAETPLTAPRKPVAASPSDS